MWLLINMCTNRSLFLQQLRLVVQLLELLCSAYIMYFLNNICGNFYLSLNWNRKNIIRYFNGQDCFIIHPTLLPPPPPSTKPFLRLLFLFTLPSPTQSPSPCHHWHRLLAVSESTASLALAHHVCTHFHSYGFGAASSTSPPALVLCSPSTIGLPQPWLLSLEPSSIPPYHRLQPQNYIFVGVQGSPSLVSLSSSFSLFMYHLV